MNISIKGTNYKPTQSIKEYVVDKVNNLEKYSNRNLSARVELERDRHHKKGDVMRAEIMLLADGKTMRAEAVSEDVFASVDLMIPKIREQISKLKDKEQTLRRRRSRSAKKNSKPLDPLTKYGAGVDL
ncbi:MAG: ribosome-associated translation inhibitor RaiA [bacterium]|nr:ribosome-associated translation inhibitor RaiA [bacterium]